MAAESPDSRTTHRLTAGQAVIRFLAAQHTERDAEKRRLIPTTLGIFGHGNVCGLGQALEEESELMGFMQPKNEQAMVHSAIGYARANRRLATFACSASIGPGSTNMVTGAAAATVNRIPVLLLPSDTFARRVQGPPMQALDDPAQGDVSANDTLRPVSVFFDRISRPEQLLAALPAAAAALTDPDRAGAVTLCLHQDVQAEAFEFPAALFSERVWRIPRRPPAPEQVREVAGLLESAKRPLIIAGGGVHYSDATEALRQFAEQFQIPVAETSAGKGSLPGSEISVGAIGHSGTRAANRLAREADLVLCIGTRLIDLTTGSNTLFEATDVAFASINLNVFDANKLGGAPIQADARLAIVALAEMLASAGVRARPEWVSTVSAQRSEWERAVRVDREACADERMSQHQLIHALNDAARAGDTLIVASGTPHVDVHKIWDTSQGTRVQMEVGFSTMGHEIPAGLGARIAQGEEGEVFILIGDGTYLMGHTELVTALQEQLKLTVVLIDNHGFQSIHALQRDRLDRSFGLEFRARLPDGRLDGEYIPIDYAANAHSYGCITYEADTPGEVARALEEAREQTRPCVVVCRTEPYRLTLDSECWWDVGVAEVAKRPETVKRATETTLEPRRRMRWFG